MPVPGEFVQAAAAVPFMCLLQDLVLTYDSDDFVGALIAFRALRFETPVWTSANEDEPFEFVTVADPGLAVPASAEAFSA